MKDMPSRIPHQLGESLERKLQSSPGRPSQRGVENPEYITSPSQTYLTRIKLEGYEEPLNVSIEVPQRSIDKEAVPSQKAVSERSDRYDQRQQKLMAQLLRCALTCLFTISGAFVLFLFMLWGPELNEQASMFVTFLLAVCGAMFLVSLFAFITPVVDVVGLQHITAVRKELESKRLIRQRDVLTSMVQEAMLADNPKKVLAEETTRLK